MDERRERDWREIARLAGILLLLLVLVALVADNRQSVDVGFVVTERRAPLFVVLFVTAALGLIIGALIRRVRRR